MCPYRIEPLAADDWPAVREIYRQGIATGSATFETEPPDWEVWSAAHLETGRLVARDGGTVLGWVALSPVSGRCVYAGVAEASVYVATDARGRGVGRALLAAAVGCATVSDWADRSDRLDPSHRAFPSRWTPASPLPR